RQNAEYREDYRTFWPIFLTFARMDQTLSQTPPEDPPMSQALEGKRVLLVDDDADILTSMQAAFEPTGAHVDMANNGNKAVEMVEKMPPDLVILDMMLPGRSGFLVLEKI